MIQLRSTQGLAIQMARDAIRQGSRRPVIVAPCGFGKSVVACEFVRAAKERGSKVWFAVDRQILVNDMSAKLDSFGIEHGVMMADHWRWRPTAKAQVVSLQTIEKRGFDYDIDILLVDEAHANMRESLLQFAERSPRTVMVGLTATPFAKGMGNVYSCVINPTTTNRQIAEGFLVPLKLFSGISADMAGAKTVAGEWADNEVRDRGRVIIGDIVANWIAKTNQFFGGPAKTICFSADVAHGREICARFNDAGYNFQQISYQDADGDRRDQLIAEFRKPDSQIHGLVSCGVLTRGFDVTDVRIGIMARPLRKSFSEFIQQVGRIQRAHPGKAFGLLLDHAGNIGRFYTEMVELFENGVSDLHNAADSKPPRKEPTQEEKTESCCSACGYVTKARICPVCGHERARRSMLQEVAGELVEVNGKGQPLKPWQQDKEAVWRQLCNVGLSRKKGDFEQAERWAKANYRSLYDQWPRHAMRNIEPEQPSRELLNWLTSKAIAWSKSQQRKAA